MSALGAFLVAQRNVAADPSPRLPITRRELP
jgi:hypothetical protein